MVTADAETTESAVDSSSNLLSAIEQSSIVPYYSSSPLTSSSEELDEPRSPLKSQTEIAVQEDLGKQPSRKIFFRGKDPLRRRSYPFIAPADPTAVDGVRKSPSYLAPPSNKFNVTKHSSSVENFKGLNAISSLGMTKKPSLLELSATKATNTLNMDDKPYDDEGSYQRDVLYKRTQDFTLSLPVTSPTVPAHIKNSQYPIIKDEGYPAVNESGSCLVDDFLYGDETPYRRDVLYTKTHDFTASMPATTPTSPSNLLAPDSAKQFDNIGVNEDSGEQEILQTSEKLGTRKAKISFEKGPEGENEQRRLSHQAAFESDPGMYFLPPLIAQATRSKETDRNEKVLAHVHREEDSNNPRITRNNLSSTSTFGDTYSEDENVYMENTDELLRDLEEKEFLGTAVRAMPESDSSSIATRESFDPIEDILTREDAAPADKRTFTSNGRAIVVTPMKEISIMGDKIEPPTTISTEEKITPVLNPPIIMVEGEIPDDPTIKRIHSHKVGKSKNCPVCKRKEEESKERVKAELEGKEVSAKMATELDAQLPTTQVPKRPPVFSHKVGKDSDCEICSPHGEIKDSAPELCCAIL